VHVAEYYKWIQATTLRGAKPPILGQGRGPKPEAQIRVGWEKAASPPGGVGEGSQPRSLGENHCYVYSSIYAPPVGPGAKLMATKGFLAF